MPCTSRSPKQAVSFLALLFSIATALADAPVIQWGDAQEGIKVGIALIEGFGRNGWLAIYARPATNYAKNLVVPELSQAFEVVLKDSSNKPVEPTPSGNSFGAPVQTKMSRGSKIRHQLRFPDAEGRPLGGLKIDDCFLVRETKDYELEVRVRLLKETGEKLVPVIFTPIKTKLHLVANTVKPLPLQK